MTASERLDMLRKEKPDYEFVIVNRCGETCVWASSPEKVAEVREWIEECPEAQILVDTRDTLKVVFPEDALELFVAPPEEDEE